MRKSFKNSTLVHDDPATRKRRLHERLQELNDKTEQELDALMKTVEKAKSTLIAKRRRN